MSRSYTDRDVETLRKQLWHVIEKYGDGEVRIPDPLWSATQTPKDFQITQRSKQYEPNGPVELILKTRV